MVVRCLVAEAVAGRSSARDMRRETVIGRCRGYPNDFCLENSGLRGREIRDPLHRILQPIIIGRRPIFASKIG
jgi:hypothetical protein